jgi:hypothetical protein
MHDDETRVKGNIIMKRRLIAYAFVFAAASAFGYLTTQPASAATRVSVAITAQPVHYSYWPSTRYYAPVPGYYGYRYYAPRPYYYGPRAPTAYWTWRNSNWDRHDRRGFNDHHDRGHHGKDRHDRHDRDNHRGH